LAIQYRKGAVRDLATLRFEEGLSITAESIEFNVLGIGHEFWIAVQGDLVIGFTVLADENNDGFRILRLEVAPSRKNMGVGTAMLKAIMEAYPRCGLSVVPSGGAEVFYEGLGFRWVSRWEMRKGPPFVPAV